MSTQNKDRLLSRIEVDEQFGIPKRFLELCIKDGKGPKIIRIGRLVRYRVADVIEWIDANTVEGEE